MFTLTILAEEKEGLRQEEDPVEDNLPSALLEEKNQEIDHLNNEIQRLEQELDNTNDNKVRSTHRTPAVKVEVMIIYQALIKELFCFDLFFTTGFGS